MKELNRFGGIFDLDVKVERLEEVSRELENPDIWNNPEQAQALGKEKVSLEEVVLTIQKLTQGTEDVEGLLELAVEAEDEDTLNDAEAELKDLTLALEKLEFRRMFSGPNDANDGYLDIQSGSGGTEAQDWANMLLRMYLRWGEAHGFKTELIELSDGDVAGIKSATIRFGGEYAFGWLRTETGVHRLVRKSPFDSGSRRHTSFASAFAYPEVSDDIEIEINPADLRIDTYRASGAGGQHVNTTDSAVRITHIPTGIVVTSSEKSQHQNRANAMKALRARLYDMEMKKREEATQSAHDNKTDIGWGHQIRSYVLQPYQLVKDLRTGVESTNPTAVLDGDLNAFMESALAHQVSGEDKQIEDVE